MKSAATRLTAGTAAAVEDLDAGPADDRALFHLINLATERRVPLLMTSRLSPGALETGLADLTSRLRALHHVELAGPDDDLLRRVLFKLFADRQLVVDPAVIEYIVVRLERSLEAANLIVAQVDADALAEGRGITKRLAGEVLDRLEAARQDSSPEAGMTARATSRYLTSEATMHLVLLGDSMLDNGAYTNGGPAVIEHLKATSSAGVNRPAA